jgi:hypothetical protein
MPDQHQGGNQQNKKDRFPDRFREGVFCDMKEINHNFRNFPP